MNCVIDKFGLHSDQNPHPLKITKGAAPRVKIKTNQNQNKSESKSGQITDKSTRGQFKTNSQNKFPSAIHTFAMVMRRWNVVARGRGR